MNPGILAHTRGAITRDTGSGLTTVSRHPAMKPMRPLVFLAMLTLIATAAGCLSPARQDLLLQASQPSVAGRAALEEVLADNRENIYPAWQRTESANFVLIAPANSPLSADPEGFLERREKSYQEILERLKDYPDRETASGRTLVILQRIGGRWQIVEDASM